MFNIINNFQKTNKAGRKMITAVVAAVVGRHGVAAALFLHFLLKY